jgi:capsular exopolysaccharide synthesis family protein
VLLIDADLRLPSVSRKLSIPSAPGLSEALMTAEPDLSSIVRIERGGWDVLPAGCIPPNPSELLGSAQMAAFLQRLSENYDFIILDLPPITIVSDALALARVVSGIVLVVRNNYSKRRELHLAIKSLELASMKVLGVVINGKTNSLSSGLKYNKYAHEGYYGSNYFTGADTPAEKSE